MRVYRAMLTLASPKTFASSMSHRNAMKLNPQATPFVNPTRPNRQLHNSDGDVAAAQGERQAPKVFCDLDGVLCDFNKEVIKIMGKPPGFTSKKFMWISLANADGFYANMEWMPGGRELWEGIVHLQPTILTGLPLGNWAEPQKRIWCERELGPDVPVICCMSRDKYRHCPAPGSILIDDRILLKHAWESAGGVFVHHVDASTSLGQLQEALEAAAATAST